MVITVGFLIFLLYSFLECSLWQVLLIKFQTTRFKKKFMKPLDVTGIQWQNWASSLLAKMFRNSPSICRILTWGQETWLCFLMTSRPDIEWPWLRIWISLASILPLTGQEESMSKVPSSSEMPEFQPQLTLCEKPSCRTNTCMPNIAQKQYFEPPSH